jgi:hypothetical protein
MALIKADDPRNYSKNTHELEPPYGIETVDLLLNMDLQQVPDAAAGTWPPKVPRK